MSIQGFIASEPYSDIAFELQFLYCGKQACKPVHTWGPGIRDHYKLTYIHSGKGLISMNNQTYLLHEGQGFVIIPDVMYYYEADLDHPWTYSWIAFKGVQAEIYLNRAGITANQPLFESKHGRWFDQYFDELLAAKQSESSSDLLLKSILYRSLGELIAAAPEGAARLDLVSSSELYVKEAIQYIEMNYKRKLSIQELAAFISIDRTYLYELFRSKLNMSPQAFLIRYRMNQACLLLKRSSLTITEIAESVGYQDPLQFSKMFKRSLGLSPRAYRERI